MRSDKQRILGWLYRREYKTGIWNFQDELKQAAIEALGKDDIDAESYVRAHSRRRWNELTEACDLDAVRGLEPTFVVVDEISMRFRWYTADRTEGLTSKKRRKLILLASRPCILSQIDTLSARDYEALSCVVCRALGANGVKLTSAGNEGGVDFYATIKFPAHSHLSFGAWGPIRIIGQCKMYQSPVSVEKVKAFVETIEGVKKDYAGHYSEAPSWFKSARGPIVGWVIGHSGFQSGAKNWAKDHGIVWADSRDLAEILSQARTYCTENPRRRVEAILSNIQEELRESDH